MYIKCMINYTQLYIIITKKMSTTITKHVTFPAALFEKIESKAANFGVSFAEYLRHLAMNDSTKKTEKQKWKEWEDSLPVYTATEEKWKEWDKAKAEDNITITLEEFKKRR